MTIMKQKKSSVIVPKSFKRTLPFLKILQKSNTGKVTLLKSFPQFVTNDIIELLHNILVGKVKINQNQKKVLANHRRKWYKFENLTSLKKRRDYIYKQKGGFITSLLPMLASLLI